MIEILNKETFKTEIFDFKTNKEWVFNKDLPVVLNFFATWCGPCHRFAPTLEEIATTYDKKLKVYKINIDEDPELAALFEIQSVPTTLFLQPNSEPILTSGALPIESMHQAIREIFNLNN